MIIDDDKYTDLLKEYELLKGSYNALVEQNKQLQEEILLLINNKK